jgi:hypothetical protein
MSNKMVRRELISAFDKLLKPYGFERKGNAWNRRTQSVIDVIDLQISKAGDAITINVGVLDTEAWRILFGSDQVGFVQQPNCTVAARIGELIDNFDKWWQLENVDVSGDLKDNIIDRVLPFIDRMHVRQAMKDWLVATDVLAKKYPPPIINLAILNYILGDTTSACYLLSELQLRTSGPWSARISEVKARLNCN